MVYFSRFFLLLIVALFIVSYSLAIAAEAPFLVAVQDVTLPSVDAVNSNKEAEVISSDTRISRLEKDKSILQTQISYLKKKLELTKRFKSVDSLKKTKKERLLEEEISRINASRNEMMRKMSNMTTNKYSCRTSPDKTHDELMSCKHKYAVAIDDVRIQKESIKKIKNKIEDITAQRNVLLTATEPKLISHDQKQSYASGVLLAEPLKKALALKTDLNLSTNLPLMLSGVSDSILGKVRLNAQQLHSLTQTLLTQLSEREKIKYREGVLRLEKTIKKDELIKRNRTIFFVRGHHKGKKNIKEGDRVVFDLKESTIKGRLLRNRENLHAVIDNNLPYIISEAIIFSGRGGETKVYCMASDVYPPEQLPDGLFGYSLLVYTVKVKENH